MRRPLLRFGWAALALAAVAVWLVLSLPDRAEPGRASGDPDPARAAAGDRSAKGSAVLRARPAQQTAPAPAAVPARLGNTGTPPPGAAVFPDGTWLPPLNGVIAPHPCPWPRQRPYSPVVEILTGDKGLQWYRHADGSRSTTEAVRRTEGGRSWIESGWVVGNPTRPLPLGIGRAGAAGPRATTAKD